MSILGALGGIISGGLGVYGAMQSASAQKKAAEAAAQAQRDATQQQINYYKQIYNQNRLDFSPYRNLGSYAASIMGRRMGMPEGYDASPVNYVAGEVPETLRQAAVTGSQGYTPAQMYLKKFGIFR
jgi:hypothetical protein